MIGELLREQVRRRAHQHHGIGVPYHIGHPRPQLEAAAVTARDQHQRCVGKRAQRDPARVGIGGFRVVVPAHAVPLADQLEAVLDAFERADRGVDGLVILRAPDHVLPDPSHQEYVVVKS